MNNGIIYFTNGYYSAGVDIAVFFRKGLLDKYPVTGHAPFKYDLNILADNFFER